MSEDHDTIVIARLRDTAEHIHSRGPVIAAQHLRDAADRIAGQRQQIEALEYLSANYPGISTKIADPVDTIDGMGQTARYQDAAIEALQKRIDDRDAEIGRLKIDLAHYREAAEGMTAQRVRELEEKLMMEQGYSSSELALAREALEAEERKVADLSAELARRMVQDIREEVDGATERIKASVTSIAADTALAVLDSLAP